MTVSKLQLLLRTAMQGKGSGEFGLSLKAAAVGWGWELWWGSGVAMHGDGELMGSWLMPMGVVL